MACAGDPDVGLSRTLVVAMSRDRHTTGKCPHNAFRNHEKTDLHIHDLHPEPTPESYVDNYRKTKRITLT